MKNKKHFTLIICLLVLPILIVSVCLAEEEPSPDIESLIGEIDSHFTRHGFFDSFNGVLQRKYNYYDNHAVWFMENYRGANRIRFYADPEEEITRTAFCFPEIGRVTDFLLSVELTLNDTFPADSNGCVIGYLNDPSYAAPEDTSRYLSFRVTREGITIDLLPYGGEKSESVSFVDLPVRIPNDQTDANTGSPVYDEFGAGKTMSLDLVRMGQEVLLFVDGEFAGNYHDENVGPFYLYYGAILNGNGMSADCSFDELNVRVP